MEGVRTDKKMEGVRWDSDGRLKEVGAGRRLE
ncbi:hypothetical protein A2U01_0052923, partial [Trifolium medium]|nr:hypothetical protein [Trifolium medium]